VLNPQDLVTVLRALGPSELLAGYKQGLRDFSRINLLRAKPRDNGVGVFPRACISAI
jgi:hypothetical protein